MSTYAEWTREADEAFVAGYVEMRRAEAERDARTQVAKAAEWRRRVEAGEITTIGYRDTPYTRLWPEHDWASAFSGIAMQEIGRRYEDFARRNPPPDQEAA